MTVGIDSATPQTIIQLITSFSKPDLEWLVKQINLVLEEAALPESATMDEAIDLLLADQCSLGRAAELVGVTRWDVMDVMKERGIPIIIDFHSPIEEIDAFADELDARDAARELEASAVVKELEPIIAL